MIHSVAPSDLWSQRRRPRRQVVLYNEALLVHPHRPIWFTLRCLLQGTGRERLMNVYRERGTRTIAQSSGRHGRPEQDIIYLASLGARGGSTPSDYDIWYRLLERLCVNAGQHHVQRLYASIAARYGEVREIFRQLGFYGYTQATVLHLSGPDWDQRTSIAPMREQSRRDHWAIHKLYGAITPHLVQHAEARNARVWGTSFSQYWHNRSVRAWVLGAEDDLTAYLRLTSGVAGHVFRLFIRTDARDLSVDVLRFGLAQLADTRPVYLMLREYQEELIAPAQDLGFQPVDEQVLMVKHTVIPVRRPILLPAFEPTLEPKLTPVSQISVPREDAQSYVRPR